MQVQVQVIHDKDCCSSAIAVVIYKFPLRSIKFIHNFEHVTLNGTTALYYINLFLKYERIISN